MPRLRRDGELRLLLHATFASMVMYYEERFQANEMSMVSQWLRESVSNVMATEGTHTKLVEWGSAIKLKFNQDNLRLTGREDHEKIEQMITWAQNVGSTVSGLRQQMAESVQRQIRIEPSASRTVGKRPAGSPRLAELPKRTCYEEDSEGEESGEESSDASASSGEEGEESGEESSVGDPCSPAKDWREMAIDVDSDDS